ncbi:MAG: spore cortex-lytic protein, partial [Ruminococcaceae bacterium]|nr:spore cortex-lytic protein [Oscillospiraceae bacterium]
MATLPVIPENITVHLGAPSSDAPNVTVSFPDYIKNVASSEIYPTWPENALRANIYAQISFALNRIYTEYYRSRGYDFDITNSTAIDQSFVYGA